MLLQAKSHSRSHSLRNIKHAQQIASASRQACHKSAAQSGKFTLHLQHSLSSPAQVPKSGDPTGTHCASCASTTPINKLIRSWTSSSRLPVPLFTPPMTAIIDPQRGHRHRPLPAQRLYHSLRHAKQSTNVCSLGGSCAAVAAASWICDRIDARASRSCLREPAARRRWAMCGQST